MAQRLSSKHHALMQALLSRGPMREDEFHALFAGVTGRNPAIHQQLFDGFVLMINMELAYLSFELRGCRNQYDGRVVYGVVNNVADDQSKLGTKYSVLQIAFYKAVGPYDSRYDMRLDCLDSDSNWACYSDGRWFKTLLPFLAEISFVVKLRSNN